MRKVNKSYSDLIVALEDFIWSFGQAVILQRRIFNEIFQRQDKFKHVVDIVTITDDW